MKIEQGGHRHQFAHLSTERYDLRQKEKQMILWVVLANTDPRPMFLTW